MGTLKLFQCFAKLLGVGLCAGQGHPELLRKSVVTSRVAQLWVRLNLCIVVIPDIGSTMDSEVTCYSVF